ncbi:MAG: branched-chain amino acid transport system ATP-binding protein livM [Streptosporangiaceae bacterium]|nr:branched-chain amino acid transport system ATP-binding protein livM [Streptosporangiaceae bacterium]
MSGTVARRAVIALAAVILAVFPLVSGNLYLQNLLIMTFLLGIGASGWNIMGGYAGYISLGNSAFIGLGAYTTGILAVRAHLSPFAGCLAGGLVCAVAAAVLSLVTRRTRGMYFVIVTFAALQLLGIVATTWSGLTGGSQGLALPLPAWSLSYQNWPFYYPLLGLLVLSVVVSAVARRSKLGLGLFAIADDEDKAAGLGLRTAVYKMIAFVFGGTFVGIAGGLYAYYVSFLNVAAVFDVVTSVLIVLAALLGGRGTVWGPVLGAFIIEPLANFTSTGLGGADAGAIRLLLFGGLLGAVVLFLPRGVLPTATRAWQRTQARRAGRPGLARPATAGGPAAAAPAAAAVPGDPGGTVLTQGSGRPDRPADVLQARGLVKTFGGLRAVDGADLTVAAGRITGLLGPNGSGKTTLFNLIDGTVGATSGQVILAGRPLGRRGRPARAHAGLARTYQLPRLFASLTVVENVVAAESRFSFRRLWRRRVTAAERARALGVLGGLGLAGHADSNPAELSYGQRKLIELAQVLWLDPVLLMLDEPAAGISPALGQRLAGLIRSLHRQGVAILLVEHDLAFLSSLCDQVYVMASGKIIASGTVAQVSGDRAVIDAYLGDEVALAPAESTA